jgi:hypothetical protein
VAAFDSNNDQAVSFDVLNPSQVAALTVIAEPTAIEWRPQPISGHFSYPAGESWSVAVVVHNVRPRPRIYWTMNNQSIEGVTVTTTSVTDQGESLTVMETISLTGKEAYNGEVLEYRIELEAVDEEGITSVAYRAESRELSAQLRCLGCHKTTTTSAVTTAEEGTTYVATTEEETTAVTTTDEETTAVTTTEEETTAVTTTEEETTIGTTTEDETIDVTTTEEETIAVTTTEEETTAVTTAEEETTAATTTEEETTAVTTTEEETTIVTTPSRDPIRVPCSFNLSSSAGEIVFPPTGVACSRQPPPVWTIR